MKTQRPYGGGFSARGLKLAALAAVLALGFTGTVRAGNSPIPFAEIGAKATADYHGDALAVALGCLGLPGTAYAVERAMDVLFTADLTTLLSTNAPAPDGLFRCTDSSPPSATAFYRLRRE